LRDSGSARALALGDYRAGIGLAGAGTLLLVSIFAGVWSGSVAVPAALAVALLVFGGYLVTLRASVAGLGALRSLQLARYYESYFDPVLVTDLTGRILARNPAARGETFAEGDGMRYRLAREAAANGIAIEASPEGLGRTVVVRTGRRRLLWRM
jgi:hypothetical protein